MLARVPRLRLSQIEALVAHFDTAPAMLAAEQNAFADVEGVGSLWARHVHTWLARLEGSTVARRRPDPVDLPVSP